MTATVKEVDKVVEAVEKVDRDIKNYYWMANQISQEDAETFIKATAYDLESTLPVAPYSTGNPTYRVVQRRMRVEERQYRFFEKVRALEKAVSDLPDEKERVVIEGCMDHVTLHKLGSMLGISKQAVYEIKEKAIRKLAVKMYLET